MAIYLNPNADNFISYKSDDIFVDKSLLIRETNACMGKAGKKFMCVTRPRRFGKTLALSILSAYYSKGCVSKNSSMISKSRMILLSRSTSTSTMSSSSIWRAFTRASTIRAFL